MIEIAKDVRDNEFSDAGPDLADAILEVAERTEPLKRRLYSKGLERKNTPWWRWMKRQDLDREIHNLLLAYFLEATA
jgi:hypothetical protein